MNIKKWITILLIVLSAVLLLVGCNKSANEQIAGMKGDAAIYGPVIFYNENFYVTPPYEHISKELPDDAEYWGTSSEQSSDQIIDGVLVADVYNLDTDENVQITHMGGCTFYKSADNQKIYREDISTNNDITSVYYECFALKAEN